VIRRAVRQDDDVTDAMLLAQIVEGDLHSLGILFDRYEADVQRIVARLGVADRDVDDLVQSTFLLVMRAAPNFKEADESGSARAWLLGLAANLVRRHRRSLMRMALRVAAWAFERPDDSAPSPADALDAKEASLRGKRALQLLSPEKREVFVLVALEGLRGEEAAAMLHIPVATVWTRLHRARRELRAHLLEEAS
jgi:RNA polymerase sigma-70 factor (ECF subfamily)